MTEINPYSNRGRILDPEKFIGRKHELRDVFSRLNTMQSVSVIGERRIGKSSFLNRIANPTPDELDSSFTIHYLDLQRVFSATEFYERACRKLKREQGESHIDLEDAIQDKKVIFCLDEFEQAYEQNFGSEFFNALRSLAQSGNLALVVATQSPLNELHDTFLQGADVTSKFHNIFDCLKLGEFKQEEAEDMVRKRQKNGDYFNDEEVSLILRLGKRHPYWLNVACMRVYDARLNTENSSYKKTDLSVVEQQIEEEIKLYSATEPIQTASKKASFDIKTEASKPGQAAESSISNDKPLPKSKPEARSNVTILGIVALFTLIGGLTGWFAMQQSNPVGIVVASTFLSFALILFLYDTFRLALNRWRA